MPSSLDLLQFQPIRFDFVKEECANNDNREYCLLTQNGDSLSAQVRRKFGEPLPSCDFSEISTTNNMLNPEFVGSSVPWTLTGGWSYDPGGFVKITADSGSVSQSVFGGIVTGGLYEVRVRTLTDTTGDDLDVFLSGTLIGSIPIDSPAGTYYFYGVGDQVASNLVEVSGTAITTQIDSIGLFRAGECMTVQVTEGTFSYDPAIGFMIDGDVGFTFTPVMEPSQGYSLKTIFTISDFEHATSIDLIYGTDASGGQPGSNGEFTWTLNTYDQHATLGLSFQDFKGVVSDLHFEQLSTSYHWALYDINGIYVQNVNINVSYCRDYMMLNLNLQEEGFAEGCYRIGLYDPYLHQDDWVELSYDFTQGGTPWTQTGNGTWNLSSPTGYEFDAASNTFAYIHQTITNAFPAPFQVAWTKFRFETGASSGPGVGASGVSVYLVDPASGLISVFGGTPGANVNMESANEGAPIGQVFSVDIEPWLEISGALNTSHWEFKNAYYKVYPYHLDYLSNCINYKAEHPCTKLIEGFPGADNLGFNSSNCNFSIRMRFRNVRINPTYKVKAEDFISSDGTRALVSGTMQKFYTFLFDYMDELGHDVVAALLLCRVVQVYNGSYTFGNNTRYFLLPQDYQPEWEKDGKYNLAMGRILAMEYDQVKTTTNCGN